MLQEKLRLGTRRSALAWAQSLWVAERIQALKPGTRVELIPIETRGDRITDLPLSQVEGKEFFSAEIDAALLAGDVDITVHSLKDLSLERPPGIALAAIPQRENPRDVVVFRDDVPQRLLAGRALRIGTSAPRRLENVPRFLAQALPGDGKSNLECVEIRGNVDTRLGRLHEPEGSARHLDGVVLAFAGLIRLWRDARPEGGRTRLNRLLQNVRWMVLPLPDCPSAPGQGALAVECRADDRRTSVLVAGIEHRASRAAVDVERAFLAELGGGCDLPVGAYATLAGYDLVLQSFLAGPGGEWRGLRRSPLEGAKEIAREEARRAVRAAG